MSKIFPHLDRLRWSYEFGQLQDMHGNPIQPLASTVPSGDPTLPRGAVPMCEVDGHRYPYQPTYASVRSRTATPYNDFWNTPSAPLQLPPATVHIAALRFDALWSDKRIASYYSMPVVRVRDRLLSFIQAVGATHMQAHPHNPVRAALADMSGNLTLDDLDDLDAASLRPPTPSNVRRTKGNHTPDPYATMEAIENSIRELGWGKADPLKPLLGPVPAGTQYARWLLEEGARQRSQHQTQTPNAATSLLPKPLPPDELFEMLSQPLPNPPPPLPEWHPMHGTVIQNAARKTPTNP